MSGPNDTSLLSRLSTLGTLPAEHRLVLAMIFRYRRSTVAQLGRLCALPETKVAEILDQLVKAGRVEFTPVGPSGLYDVALAGSLSLGEPRFAWGPIVPLFRQFNLLCDQSRVRALDTAIDQFVQAGDVVFDLGCGLGLLTLMAARKGARVFSVEIDPYVATAAECFLKSHLDPHQFTLCVEDVMKFSPGLRADVIICEMLDTALVSEMQIPVMNRAVEELLKPGGRVIPRSATTTITAAEVDFNIGPWSFPVPHFDAVDTNRIHARRSQPVVIHSADFSRYNETILTGEFDVLIGSPGTVNAIVLETSVDFGTGVQTPGSAWLDPPLVLPVMPQEFRDGVSLRVQLRYEMGGTLNDIQVRIPSVRGGHA